MPFLNLQHCNTLLPKKGSHANCEHKETGISFMATRSHDLMESIIGMGLRVLELNCL